MLPYNQLCVADIFEDYQTILKDDKPLFLSLLEQHSDLDETIPFSFYNHFYSSTDRTRKYPLKTLLWL